MKVPMLIDFVLAKFVTAPGWIFVWREDESTRGMGDGQLHICCAVEKIWPQIFADEHG
jgi:hypothetical protein